ncbi:MAG TPA: hypothetical protein ENK43_04830, partial [Planctomycetes bacterium]|nr:hypothetical protein [Planctomycetota bacterium]
MKKNDLTILAFLVVGLLALLVAFLLIGDDEADLEPEGSPPAVTSASETPRRSASHAGHGKESKPPRPAASPSNDKEEDTAAQPTRALEGRVLDLEGKPVPGAHVIYRARLEDRELRLEARADPEGRYRLEGIPFAATRTPFRLPSPVFLIRAKGFAPRRLVAAAIGLSDPGLGAVVRRDFRLARGGSLRIRVVDMAEGLPIAGATVTLYGKASFPAPFDLDAPLASLITDEDGIAHLSPFLTSKGALLDPLGSLKGFIVRAEHPGFAAMGTFAFPVEEEGETRNVTLRLPLSAALEGRVLDAQGQPQRNALVEVDLDPWATRAVGTVDGRSTAPIAPRRLFHELPTFGTGPPAVLRALTNERGRYVFEGLPAKARGTTTAHVTARMSDLVAGSITAILVAGQTTVVDDLRLDVNPDALVVRGLVEDEEGRPIGRARVEAERAEPVETDGTGAFTVILSREKLPKKGLPALTVEAEGYAKWMGEIPDPVPSEGLRIVLQRPHGLEGSVVDAAGEPMPDVFVTAADTTSRFSSTVATDGAGR